MAFPAQADGLFLAKAEVAVLIASTNGAVRDALRDVFCQPGMNSLSDEARSTAELVLAEVLNNIVEHAYETDKGQMELRLQRVGDRLTCQVIDGGSPMPDQTLPLGAAPEIGRDTELAEGGYGWFLIRSLTRDLVYRRENGRNHLSFQLKIEQ